MMDESLEYVEKKQVECRKAVYSGLIKCMFRYLFVTKDWLKYDRAGVRFFESLSDAKLEDKLAE